MTIPDKKATDRSSLLARLDGVIGLDLTVTATRHHTPSLLEISLHGDDLIGLEVGAGQDIMVEVPVGNAQFVRRRYSIVDFSPTTGTMSLLIALKGTGSGEAWALALQAGDVLDAVGPRGKQPVSTQATTHLFIADHSAVAATSQMIRSIEFGHVHVVASFPTSQDVISFAAREPSVKVSVTALSPVDHGDVQPFLDCLSAFEDDLFRSEGLQCYLNAEFSMVNTTKALLLERGVSPAAIATKAYWRRNKSNAPHGEPIKD